MYDNFIWFIEERESIRLKKEAGLLSPWTDDPTLAHTHFLNINPLHDPCTELIHDFISDMTEWEKLFYIFVYRTCYSNPDALLVMTGIWMHDYRNLKFHGIDNFIEYHPYTFRLSPASSIQHFLLSFSLPILKDFWPIFEALKNASILVVEEDLFRLFTLRTGRPSKLLSSIIACDISLAFPSKVNPDSECYISLSARQSLRKFSGRNKDVKIEMLRERTGLNYSSLNRVLNEWYKYLKRKEYCNRQINPI